MGQPQYIPKAIYLEIGAGVHVKSVKDAKRAEVTCALPDWVDSWTLAQPSKSTYILKLLRRRQDNEPPHSGYLFEIYGYEKPNALEKMRDCISQYYREQTGNNALADKLHSAVAKSFRQERCKEQEGIDACLTK